MNRRTLLSRIVAGFAAVTAMGISVPFLRSLMPSFDNEMILDVDLSAMTPGDVRSVRWLGRNVLLIKRRPGPVAALDLSSEGFEDADSSRSSQPEFAVNPGRARKADHLVVFSNCTHLGCEVEPLTADGFKGFSCPCHRSRFDIAGRVEKGSAAKKNLEVPYYEYVGREVIRLRKV